ncbi:hypothetical protein [Dongia deserti]|uniref:hypothetical protein n=1 Tax=Dongia deserti TaxID=2268030 RepID=UPI000E64A26E|nr:hypothetical protein [Dongia deserti]
MKALFGSIACLAIILGASMGQAQDNEMTFFITSTNPGDGGNLGGLEGADAHCQTIAEAAGAGDKTWRAYLSTSSVNARDRIGDGPWHNAKGELIASNLEELHGDANRINKETALTETGDMVKGRGETPNQHDILTGSNADGTVAAGMTCEDWTSDASTSQAFVGHHDRIGLRDDAPSKSWNASHPSRGCGQEDLPKSGGAGFFYCFTAD